MSLTFVYRARTPGGISVTGTMRALDRAAALAALRERMLIPSQLRPLRSGFSLRRFTHRAKPHERLGFFRSYAALEQAGVDFSSAFDLLIDQAQTPRMRDTLASVRAAVETGGEKLWSAMARRPDDFSDLEVAMVAAGEEAGNRQEILHRLATFLERDRKLRNAIAAALWYPALVLAGAAAMTAYLFVSVLPQFAQLFAGFGVEPSGAMRALLGVHDVFDRPAAVVVAALFAAALVALAARTVQSDAGSFALDALRLRTPLVGDIVRKSIVARLCRVLSTLLQSGVHQLRALEIAIPVAESPVFSSALRVAGERLACGTAASLDEALSVSHHVPPLVLGFVRVGTRAGNVPAMLTKLAEYYEDDVEATLSALPSLVQTAVTVGVGAIVAAIVYLVYVPLSSLGTAIR